MPDSGLPEISYAEFSNRLHTRSAHQRIPVNGSIEITERCNVRCQHCYVRKDGADGELTTEQWFDVLDQLAEAGCLWLLITGGEPMLRPDWMRVYEHAKRQGMLITLFTNGTMITPRVIEFLKRWPPFAIEISIYGYSAEVYEEVTGIAGSRDRCYRGIERVVEAGLPLTLKTPVMTINHHELPQMQQFARERGLEYRFDAELNPTLWQDTKPVQLRLSTKDTVALDASDEKRAGDWRHMCTNPAGPPKSPEKVYHCGAGRDTFHIDSRGRLTGCMIARREGYDLKHGDFRQGWDTFLGDVITRERTKASSCTSCELSGSCGQCPAQAQLLHGDDETIVDYHCELTKLRAKTFGEGSQP